MERLLSCKITPGQFSGEFAVQGKLFDDTEFSLFALEEDLDFQGPPPAGGSTDGWIRVAPLTQDGDLLLVALPQPTLENGQAITVKTTQLKNPST